MKKFLAVMSSFFLALAVFAAEAPGFSARIIATKAVNIEEQFAGILPGRPPFFPQAVRAVCGESFFVKIVFAGAALEKGSVSLTGKITVSFPDGKKQVVPLKKYTQKLQGYAKGVHLLDQSLQVTFQPQEPQGRYTYELELTDNHAGKTAKALKRSSAT